MNEEISNIEIEKFIGEEGIFVDVGTWDNIEPSLTLARMGIKVIAIDKYQKMKEFNLKLKEVYDRGEVEKKVYERIFPMKIDINRLAFKNDSIDGFLFYYSTSWLEQFGSRLINVYREVKRVIKNEGVVIIVEPSVDRAEQQLKLLRTQMKAIRKGTLVLGYKVGTTGLFT